MNAVARFLFALCLAAQLVLAGCGGGGSTYESPPEEDPAIVDDTVGPVKP